ncbi:hypothetical protein IWQ61_003491 [Dispira simplex]|nr:hypothetical protein IWQ61_003491 [Dispira simplex]
MTTIQIQPSISLLADLFGDAPPSTPPTTTTEAVTHYDSENRPVPPPELPEDDNISVSTPDSVSIIVAQNPKATFRCYKLPLGQSRAIKKAALSPDTTSSTPADSPGKHSVSIHLEKLLATTKPSLNEFDVITDAIYKEIQQAAEDLAEEYDRQVAAVSKPHSVNQQQIRHLERHLKAQLHGMSEMWRMLEGLLMEESDNLDSFAALQKARKLATKSKHAVRSALDTKEAYRAQLQTKLDALQRKRAYEAACSRVQQAQQNWEDQAHALANQVTLKHPSVKRPSADAPTHHNVMCQLQRTLASLGTDPPVLHSLPVNIDRSAHPWMSAQRSDYPTGDLTSSTGPQDPRQRLRDHQRWFQACTETLRQLSS